MKFEATSKKEVESIANVVFTERSKLLVANLNRMNRRLYEAIMRLEEEIKMLKDGGEEIVFGEVKDGKI